MFVLLSRFLNQLDSQACSQTPCPPLNHLGDSVFALAPAASLHDLLVSIYLLGKPGSAFDRLDFTSGRQNKDMLKSSQRHDHAMSRQAEALQLQPKPF